MLFAHFGVIAHQSGRNDIAVHLIAEHWRRSRSADVYKPANVLKDQRDFVPAIAHFQRALALKPENGEVHYRSGASSGQIDEPRDMSEQ